jgi:hypothetical protein
MKKKLENPEFWRSGIQLIKWAWQKLDGTEERN